MAGLHMNPVMNIITLPFALVVSVIAATTVFRNVFTAYDNFTADSNSPSGASGPNRSDGPTLRTGARILFNHNSTSQQMSTNEIPLGDYKSTHNMEAISVHKVVDVEVDGVPTQTVCERLLTLQNDLRANHRLHTQRNIGRDFNDPSSNFTEEKARAL